MFKKLARKIVGIFPKKIQTLYYRYEEALWYIFFGVLTTAVSFVSAGISKYFLELIGANTHVVSVASTVFSWICAVTFAYITNRLWVFESKTHGARAIMTEAAAFFGGRVFTLIVEIVIMELGNSIIGINYWVTKIIANVVVLILNFVISKLFVFKDDKEKNNEQI